MRITLKYFHNLIKFGVEIFKSIQASYEKIRMNGKWGVDQAINGWL